MNIGKREVGDGVGAVVGLGRTASTTFVMIIFDVSKPPIKLTIACLRTSAAFESARNWALELFTMVCDESVN